MLEVQGRNCLNETETKELRKRVKKSGSCEVDYGHEDRDPKALIQFFRERLNNSPG